MEKDEKIRIVQSQRTRALGILAAAALGIILLGVWLLSSPSSSDNNNSNNTLRKKISDIRNNHEQFSHITEKKAKTLADMHRVHDKERHSHDVHQQHKELLGEKRHRRRHDHYPAEENVAVQQQQNEDDAATVQGNKQQEAAKTKVNKPPQQQQRESEQILVQRVAEYDKNVREIKKNVVTAGGFMETDSQGVAAAQALQEATRQLLKLRYGATEPYRVKVDLEFQPSNPTYATLGPTDSFVIELAPARLVPHSVFTFLEVARQWDTKKGAFHRRANHVLQVMVGGRAVQHLAFQEYSPDFPHVKGTVGYAGRPSGPAWYVSIQGKLLNFVMVGMAKQNNANLIFSLLRQFTESWTGQSTGP